MSKLVRNSQIYEILPFSLFKSSKVCCNNVEGAVANTTTLIDL